MREKSEAPKQALDNVLRAVASSTFARRRHDGVFEFDVTCTMQVSARQAALIADVVAEAMLNSIDYSHPAGIPGKIAIRSEQECDGRVGIKVADDGVGLPEGFDTEFDGGEGIRTMRRASAELGAILSFRSTPLGLTVGLLLPAPADCARMPS